MPAGIGRQRHPHDRVEDPCGLTARPFPKTGPCSPPAPRNRLPSPRTQLFSTPQLTTHLGYWGPPRQYQWAGPPGETAARRPPGGPRQWSAPNQATDELLNIHRPHSANGPTSTSQPAWDHDRRALTPQGFGANCRPSWPDDLPVRVLAKGWQIGTLSHHSAGRDTHDDLAADDLVGAGTRTPNFSRSGRGKRRRPPKARSAKSEQWPPICLRFDGDHR